MSEKIGTLSSNKMDALLEIFQGVSLNTWHCQIEKDG